MLRRIRDDESGAVAVVVAVCLVIFVGFAVLAVDMGHWYNVRRQLQSAADAAAIAGCMDLARGESNATIWATVEEYAGRNVAGHLTNVSVVPYSPGGDSSIEADAVKVTVESDSPAFFAHIFGVAGRTIRAQARAKTGWVYGVNGPVPWSIPVLRVTEMEAEIGGTVVVMDDADDDGVWTGVAPAGASGPVSITARNQQDFEETFTDIVTVGSIPPSSTIAAIDAPQVSFDSGAANCTVRVTLKEPLPADHSLKFGGKNLTDMALVNPSTNTYEGTAPLPTTSDPYVNAPLKVTCGKGNDVETIEFEVLVRRANFILKDVTVTPIATTGSDLVQISARALDFDYGVQYELKVEGGAGTTGNYLALDFASLDHSVCGYPLDVGGHSGGADYRDYIVGVQDLQIHVNDVVTSLPGDMVGPTSQGIDDRIPDPLVSWDTWSVDKPATKQLIVVPITEKLETVSGRADLKIISFATFFVEEKPSGAQDPVVGRFVQYLTPGVVVGPNPPYPMSNPGVYLTTQNVNF